MSTNARLLLALLSGQGAPAHRAAVALNAGALAWVAGRADSLGDGVALALDALAGDGAARRLADWARLSHGT